MSRRSSDSQDTVVNSEEINYPKIQNDLDDWKLPKVSNQEIYKKGTFKFFTDYTIKTSEMTVSLEQDDQVIRLLDNRSVEKHKKDGYNFIHFGMIQVAAKPLTRLGLNTAIVMCLRDNRHLEYRDSIIGAVQAGLNDGPVYFQCYPNFTVRLRDADILDSVVLHIKTHGFKIKPGNSPVSIITRFAYKSMNTSVGSGALCTSPKGETTYFHSDMLDKSDFIIPKKILWKDVDFPENWHFANAVPAIAQRSESIEQIVQYPDGGGELVFSKSFRHSSSPRVSVYEPSRASSSSIPVRTTREEEGSSSGNPKNVKLTGVRSYTNVARPFYSEENESTQESQQDESPVMSPTYSQMINTISLSDEDFEINKDLLRKDFYSEVNKQRNDWFFSTVPKVIRTIYQEEFYAYLRQEKKNIKFWIWFELFKQEEYPDYPFKRIKVTSSNNENKPYEFSKDFQENPQVNQAFVDRINQKIKDNLVTPLTDQPDKRINMVKGDISSEEEADELIKMFEEPHNQIINNLETFKTRNYYPRPTFPDMQFEERNQYTQASYTSGTIYEWNIDGMTEYNILTKLQEMTMVSTAYKLNNRLPDHAVAQTIVAGFTGQLKGWWIIISLLMKNSILKAYRINESNEVVKDEDGQDIEDAVATLIYSISKHFIGDPAKIKDKTADLLTNLKCPKLHDFRWYKEVFLTKVMLRIKIREQYNGQIPYDKLTYGEIISIVTGEGIKLCNDFKLKQQMKNEQKIYKNEFGSFCSQFGFSQKKLCLPLRKTKFDQQSPKDVSIKELHEEVKQHKKEIKELRQFISLGLSDLQDQINRIGNQEIHTDIPESSHVNDNETNTFLNTVSRVIFQRWEISLTIVVKDKFVFDIIALIDSGAAENCLQESLVPIPLCEETSESLFGANGQRLAIKYKLTDVHIRNHDICIKQTFILVKNLKEKALLGIPFLSSIYPLWVDNQDESAAFPSLGRTFKTKWWDALKNDACTEAVKQYFLKNLSQVSASDDMSQFLLKKQQLQAMLAAAKTPQEFQKTPRTRSCANEQMNYASDSKQRRGLENTKISNKEI
ncbi:hypothetical protein CK203_100889 [Vitis vinifera]|uniref:Polyprotein n=1 Tax=Vitis vinifera TaxID=29760 RepID=A0A438E6Z2_VITVI|nr:hypothetical protein CK203_100889 [Vitis vinifera]